MRVPAAEFLALDLEVHGFLDGVPLHDVSAVDLPGGGPNRTTADVRTLLASRGRSSAGLPVRVLFGTRHLIGRLLGWDRVSDGDDAVSFRGKLTQDQRHRSSVEPGTPSSIFEILYEYPGETVGEIRNATVHAFSCYALQRTPGGYRLYWAIYVRPMSWMTPFYMAAIEPFRRFVVYPDILRRFRASWIAAFPDD